MPAYQVNMKPQLNNQQSRRKKFVQPSITSFLTKKTEKSDTKKQINQPTHPSKEEGTNEKLIHKENLKPLYINVTDCNLKESTKDKGFNATGKFIENEKIVNPTNGTTYYNSKEKDKNYLQDKVKEGCGCVMCGPKTSLYSHNIKTNEISLPPLIPRLIPIPNALKESLSKTEQSQKPQILKPIEQTNLEKNSTNKNVLQTSSDTGKHPSGVVRSKRQPNEIQVASLVFPVLIRDPPLKDLRQALNSCGVFKPFSFNTYGFQGKLEDIGLEQVHVFIQTSEIDAKTTNLKTCFYCGFVSESRLVLSRHLEVTHKNRFKRWPFTSRMDFKLLKSEEKKCSLFG